MLLSLTSFPFHTLLTTPFYTLLFVIIIVITDILIHQWSTYHYFYHCCYHHEIAGYTAFSSLTLPDRSWINSGAETLASSVNISVYSLVHITAIRTHLSLSHTRRRPVISLSKRHPSIVVSSSVMCSLRVNSCLHLIVLLVITAPSNTVSTQLDILRHVVVHWPHFHRVAFQYCWYHNYFPHFSRNILPRYTGYGRPGR